MRRQTVSFGMLSVAMLGLCGCVPSSSSTSSAAKTGTAESTPEAAAKPGAGASDPSQQARPKLVASETMFDFGVMEIGQPGTHEFVIKNEGTAPLTLEKVRTTCKCTVGTVGDKPIAPGESGTVTLTWTPAAGQTSIRQSAEIKTNDPLMPMLTLSVGGKLQERVKTVPAELWPVNDILEGHPSESVAYVLSPVIEKFEIKEIENKSDVVKVEYVPMTEAELTEHAAKSGYKVNFKVLPEVAVGSFRLPLTFKTDVKSRKKDGSLGDEISVTVDVAGKRTGPISIFGPNFKEEFMAVTLGNFDALKGKKATLNMFVQAEPPGGLKFEEIKLDPKELKVTLEPDPKSVGRAKRYFLTIEYPPNAPRINRMQDEKHPGVIEVKTNHPSAPQMRFEVLFNAY